MAKRRVCLYKGAPIGIESIFTIVNGKQINIPEKLEKLRALSQGKELFCPCGCGSNLSLVAGERNLREQHFRLLHGENNVRCNGIYETDNSINSKIVLKCWLEDKLVNAEVDSRIPIYDVDDVDRKYEFSFLSRSSKLAVSYYNNLANISDDKLKILESNSKEIHLIYVVDEKNSETYGQYPEHMMKIQNRQGYCLFLSIEDEDYYKAQLEVVYYEKDLDGLWKKLAIVKDLLAKFEIADNKELIYLEKSILNYVDSEINAFKELQEKIRMQREKEQERINQERESLRQKNEQSRIEREKQFEKWQKEQFEIAQAEQERENEEEKEIFYRVRLQMNQQEKPVIDSKGRRWLCCKYCDTIALEAEFNSYGGPGEINLGVCKKQTCGDKHLARLKKIMQENGKTFDLLQCPECGGRLVKRRGRIGEFLGCQNYPNCRYTRTIRK